MTKQNLVNITKQPYEVRTDRPLGFIISTNAPMDAVSEGYDLGLVKDGDAGSVLPLIQGDTDSGTD